MKSKIKRIIALLLCVMMMVNGLVFTASGKSDGAGNSDSVTEELTDLLLGTVENEEEMEVVTEDKSTEEETVESEIGVISTVSDGGLEVQTTYGAMSGVAHEGAYEGITSFRGVPYAAAPIGDLRWAPPQDPDSWEGMFAADTYAKIVRQNGSDTENEPWKSDFYPDGTPEQDEDGLYLNVFTNYTGESNDTAERPVFIWFHGGGLGHGYSYEVEFNGEELAKKGVIVVTVGHRLNAFGYMTLPQLTAEQGSSGNYGLMDQFKALDWVCDNIEAFGGDPDNITIGGQSGGTSKSIAMAISPYNGGRIKNIITQSSIPHTTTYRDMEDVYTNYQNYLRNLDVAPDASVEYLRTLDADMLLQGASGTMVKDNNYIVYSSVREAYEDGALDGINILGGSNLGESGVPRAVTDAASFYTYYKNLLGSIYDDYDFENAIRVTDENAVDTARKISSYINVMRMRMFGNYYTDTTGGDAYVYMFSHRTPSLPEEKGMYRDSDNLWAWHSSELWYTFASLREGVPAVRPWTDYDFELADKTSTYWANFIKTGDPNGDGLETWPRADASLGYLDLGDTITGYNDLTDLEKALAAYVSKSNNYPVPGELMVETTYGTMTGVPHKGEYEGITSFRGVPYAAAPVGDLRWAPPQDPASWSGIFRADTYAKIVRQNSSDTAKEPWKSDFYPNGTPEQDEDGLYLNITTSYTGGGANADRPVFIWFHGGGLNHGYSYEVEFNGEELAKKGIVLVTVGHRLNSFGYLALPQLTAEQGQSGNYGLMDQFKALDWVWENIEEFGGDRDNITIGGQSGGASKSIAMAISPYNNGRIKNVIMQSGLQYTATYRSLEDAEAAGTAWLERIGVNPNAELSELRALDGDLLLQGASGSMTMDGEYITYPSAKEAIENGAMDGINILTGTALGEASYQSAETAEEFYAKYKELLGDLYDLYDFENLVKVTDENANDTSRRLASMGLTTQGSRNLMSDRLFGKYYTNLTGGDVYAYLFSHFTPSLPEEEGTDRDSDNLWAWHSSDLWYTFNSLRDGMPAVRPWTDYDFELGDIASTYWANFMKTGDPNGAGLTAWPKADASLGYMDLGDEVEAISGALTDVEKLLAEFASQQFDIPYDANDTRTVSTSSNDGGSITGGKVVMAGEDIKLTVTPNDGFKLVSLLINGVSVDLSDITGGAYTLEDVNSDTAVRALFVEDKAHPDKYPDVKEMKDEWYYNAVDLLTGLGMMEGDAETSLFRPEDSMNRAEFTKIIYTLADTMGMDVELADSTSFPDVEEGYWGVGYIGWANENEIVQGDDKGNFKPLDTITREQMAAIMMRFFEDFAKVDLPGDIKLTFTDTDDISKWAADEGVVDYVVKTGLMQGHGDNTFTPQSSVRRNEAAQVMCNYITY